MLYKRKQIINILAPTNIIGNLIFVIVLFFIIDNDIEIFFFFYVM